MHVILCHCRKSGSNRGTRYLLPEQINLHRLVLWWIFFCKQFLRSSKSEFASASLKVGHGRLPLVGLVRSAFVSWSIAPPPPQIDFRWCAKSFDFFVSLKCPKNNQPGTKKRTLSCCHVAQRSFDRVCASCPFGTTNALDQTSL